MKNFRFAPISSLILAAWLAACTGFRLTPAARPTPTESPAATAAAQATGTPTPTATPSPLPTATATQTASPTVTATPGSARACAFIPGVSVPARMPPVVMVAATPAPTSTPGLLPNSPVDAGVTEQQLKVFQQINDLVEKNYVYRDFNGLDWKATGDKYEALIKKGLKQEDFYKAMSRMIGDLGDGHSAFLTPDEVKDQAKEAMGKIDYVGIGAYTDLDTVPGQAIITEVMPGSPAEKAGLKPHDIIQKVDGGHAVDQDKRPLTLGQEGTSVTVTVQTPGQPMRDITLTRKRITSQPKVDFCLFPGTRLGYIRWFTYSDTTIVSQTHAALKAMSASQPLDGLILDNRYNNGGLIDVMTGVLSLFTKGKQADIVSGQSSEPFTITPQDLNGSQQIPLVILIGPNTQSAGEIASGMLHLTRGARLVGEHTGGHVEELLSFDLGDGSRLNLAVKTFQPIGLPNNAWEHNGVAPDVQVPERWDLFTEATDPSIAEGVKILMGK